MALWRSLNFVLLLLEGTGEGLVPEERDSGVLGHHLTFHGHFGTPSDRNDGLPRKAMGAADCTLASAHMVPGLGAAWPPRGHGWG